MVGKLIKHEMKAYLRSLLPVQLVLLGMGIITRVVQFFESDSVVYSISFGSSLVIFIISILAALLLTLIIGVSRFYKNLFTGEGYLSFTLPVTSGQQLFTKTLVSFIFSLITVVVAVLSSIIAMGLDVFSEVVKAAGYLLGLLAGEVGGVNLTFYIIEAIVLVLILIIGEYLTFYACISLGQLTRKNKVLAAVGIYFAYYVICQILGTVLMVFMYLLSGTALMDKISNFITNNPNEATHIGLCACILFSAAMAVVYYIISYQIIKKRLNLE